jgi:predicted RNA polymerase sigma factor
LNQITELYTILAHLKPGPIVALNKAIAMGYGKSPAHGLEALRNIKELQHHHLYHAAMGDFFYELGDQEQARLSYEQALQLTSSKSEKKLLQTKISEINSISTSKP